jgi:type I restriction enzyme S subunit
MSKNNTPSYAPVGDYLEKIKTCSPAAVFKDSPFDYLDIGSVDRDTKTVTGSTKTKGVEAPSRARQVVHTGDVLVSTVRPNLNAVAQVGEEYHNAVASTGFCVLRPKAGVLHSNYLLHWTKSPAFINDMVARATGAHYPAVSDKIVKTALIPILSFDEQRRIAETLDTADALHRKDQELLRKYDALAQSIFHEMFGDLVTNTMGWPEQQFKECGSLDRGVSKHRPRNAPELLGGPYPLIQTGDVANCDGFIKSHNQTYSEFGLKQSKLWKSGTLCITIAANIAKTGVLTFPACFPDSVVGFTPNASVTVNYIRFWMMSMQAILERDAPESAQKNINLEILRNLSVPVAPIELQRQFEDRLLSVVGAKDRAVKSSTLGEQLLQSALTQYFA